MAGGNVPGHRGPSFMVGREQGGSRSRSRGCIVTRRGSLIYYFTAWILGCFFTSLAVWSKDLWGAARLSSGLREVFGLIFFYFYGLVFGALSALIGGLLLRRVAALFPCKKPAHWAIFGAILEPILIVVLGTWGRRTELAGHPGFRLLSLLTFGPKTVLEAGWWLAIPAGAATGYFLGRVQCAFDPAQHAAAGVNQPSA
jgi:hypothetical protein